MLSWVVWLINRVFMHVVGMVPKLSLLWLFLYFNFLKFEISIALLSYFGEIYSFCFFFKWSRSLDCWRIEHFHDVFNQTWSALDGNLEIWVPWCTVSSWQMIDDKLVAEDNLIVTGARWMHHVNAFLFLICPVFAFWLFGVEPAN